MKDDDLPTSTPSPQPLQASSATSSKKDSSDSSGRGRYKVWALAAILLLALWSMFTGTVTLRWSAGNLNRITGDLDAPIHDADLDVLEIEEREKLVRHMWDVYLHSHEIQLPRFWQEAFEAAYEDMASDATEVREAAVSEIAKMSVRVMDLDPPPAKSKVGGDGNSKAGRSAPGATAVKRSH